MRIEIPKSWEEFCDIMLSYDPDTLEKTTNDNKTIKEKILKLYNYISNQNYEEVRRIYKEIFAATIYKELKSDVNKTGDFYQPIAGSTHYGCGVIGEWFALEFRPHQEYFTHYTQQTQEGKQGWSMLPRGQRDSFERYYRHQLPLRAHLASNPFLNNPLTFILLLDDSKTLKDKKDKDEKPWLLIERDICTTIHNWLLRTKEIHSFLDLGEVPLPDINDGFWSKFLDYIKKNISNMFPTEMVDTNKRRVAFRAFIAAFYSVLHLKFFEKGEEKIGDNYIKGILVRIHPIFKRPPEVELGYEHYDFSNFIGSYVLTELDKPNIEKIMNLSNEIQSKISSIVSYLSYIEKLLVTSTSLYSALTQENIIRECSNIEEEVLTYMNRWSKFLKKADYIKYPESIKEEDKNPKLKLREDIINNRKLVGASKSIIELFDRLFSRLKESEPFSSIFLYSEPGCGKEDLSLLCHLMYQHTKPNKNALPYGEIETLFGTVDARRIGQFLDQTIPLLKKYENQIEKEVPVKWVASPRFLDCFEC